MNWEKKTDESAADGDGRTIRYRFSYPYFTDKTKAAKRANAAVSDILEAYRKKAAACRAYTYHECSFRSFCGISFFFETESKGPDGAYAYVPFALNFDDKGRLIPLYEKTPKKIYKEAKRFFEDKGLKFGRRDLLYFYRVTEDGAEVFASRGSYENRRRRGVIRRRVPLPPDLSGK